jgi:hypothetical protein
MIDLSVQDRIDGLGKVEDLRGAIGQTYSDNWSSTGRSRLEGVSRCGNFTWSREVRSEWNTREPAPGLVKRPSWLTWNGLFY